MRRSLRRSMRWRTRRPPRHCRICRTSCRRTSSRSRSSGPPRTNCWAPAARPLQRGGIDDGSGRFRWWDGRQWTGHSQPLASDPRSRPTGGGSGTPAYTFGVVAFIPALHAAIKLQRRDLWLWASGLIAGDLIVWGLLGGTSSNPDGSNTPIQDVGVFIAVVLAVVGTIHAFRIREEVFGASTAVNPVAGTPAGLDPAVGELAGCRSVAGGVGGIQREGPGPGAGPKDRTTGPRPAVRRRRARGRQPRPRSVPRVAPGT